MNDTALYPTGPVTAESAGEPRGPEPACDIAAWLYLARAGAVRGRMRPSASLEPEPTRLLLTHGSDSDRSGRAFVYASGSDVGAALRAAEVLALAEHPAPDLAELFTARPPRAAVPARSSPRKDDHDRDSRLLGPRGR